MVPHQRCRPGRKGLLPAAKMATKKNHTTHVLPHQRWRLKRQLLPTVAKMADKDKWSRDVTLKIVSRPKVTSASTQYGGMNRKSPDAILKMAS